MSRARSRSPDRNDPNARSRSRSPRPKDPTIDVATLFNDRANVRDVAGRLYNTLKRHILILSSGPDLWSQLQNRFTQFCADVRRMKQDNDCGKGIVQTEYVRRRKTQMDQKVDVSIPNSGVFWPVYILLRTALVGEEPKESASEEAKRITGPGVAAIATASDWINVFDVPIDKRHINLIEPKAKAVTDQHRRLLSVYDQWCMVLDIVAPHLDAEMFSMPTIWFKMADCKVMRDQWPEFQMNEWGRAAFESSSLGGQCVVETSDALLKGMK